MKYLLIVTFVAYTLCGPLTSDFFNPLPKADPVQPSRIQFVSRTTNAEIWRIQDAIKRQGQEITDIIFYGNDIKVTKVPCAVGQVSPCYMAELKGYPMDFVDVNRDPLAFVNLARRAITMGLIRPNRVVGTNSL
eukprot:NODE_8609_length_662_cov_33.205937_g7984_i0.p1 GENE.NODE_8609_length_662_cov_33.205937_g7984_i0~~NODE_8609_length_662_cov_33.205937_g7984_i0.p1  ORF type:complete len:152 (-),score=29.85 NODE_8609_length_662_cov_33.205937_g7984_i0:206-607(-)